MSILRRRRKPLADVPPVPEVPERAHEIRDLERQLARVQERAWRSTLRTVEVVDENHFAKTFREALSQ